MARHWSDYAQSLTEAEILALPEPARAVVEVVRGRPAKSLARHRGEGPEGPRCCGTDLIGADMLIDISDAESRVREIVTERLPQIPLSGEAWLCTGCLALLHREQLVQPGELPGTA